MATPSLLQLAVDPLLGQTVDPANVPKRIPRDDWYEEVSKFFQPQEGYVFVETPLEEMREIERLLGMEPFAFSAPYIIKTKIEKCPSCERRNTFLDVVKTGLRVHKPEFLRDVFLGKHGHIINGAQAQRCECYKCGAVLPKEGTKYSAPKLVPDQADMERPINAPPYSFSVPIYSYRFD